MTRTRVALGGAGVIAALALGGGQLATASGRPARRLAPAVGRCQEQTLRITLAQASPGADHHGYVLLFHNRGAACTLKGYPGVDGFSAQGHRLVSARRTKSGYLGGVAPGRPIPLVHLPQGRTASAMLEWVDDRFPALLLGGALAPNHPTGCGQFGPPHANLPEIRAPVRRADSSRRAGNDRAGRLSWADQETQSQRRCYCSVRGRCRVRRPLGGWLRAVAKSAATSGSM